jgi:biotin carboxyl carrier protein
MTQRTYRNGESTVAIGAKRQGNKIVLTTGSGEHSFEWQQLSAGEYVLRTNGQQKRVVVAQEGADRWVWVDGRVHHLVHETAGASAHPTSSGNLLSPMPGLVLKVFVAAGDPVKRNQVLVVLEAMKMQYEITAPRNGVVAEVAVKEGQQVDGDVPLVLLEEEEA